MAFSASDAAFEGFRLTRRSPVAILIWAAFYLVITVVTLVLAGGPMAMFMQQAAALEGVAEPSPEQIMPLMGAYFAMLGVILPISLILGAVLYAAVNRAVVRPAEKSFGYLRLGGDELRVFVVCLVLSILWMIGAGVAVGVFAVLVGVLTATVSEGLGVLVAILGGLALAAVAIWAAVRLSLALPITVAEKRIAIFDSWRLTRGHFWGLLGMAILAFILTVVVQFLGWIVFMPIFFLMGGGLAELASPGFESADMGQFIAALGPIAIVGAIFLALLSALQMAIMYAPFAAAYRALKGEDEAAEPAAVQ